MVQLERKGEEKGRRKESGSEVMRLNVHVRQTHFNP